ncbi:putative HTH-type transcriptional regulator [Arthrobacter sp. SO5]|uniref:RrF2 family transcriptional regulator n=1 Tax=Arthrobacter sp. SO5 TaxID=1897055 RepID=UPI001E348E53|nr:Rrf2 family transcriptional regulator [Arthrobacter sp. SO5]MCB5274247.1 putative HTH-type transcriptional regulator [Arthrobacter sp. SO5]
MKTGRGVEWAVHSCVNMAWTPAGEAVNSARLAAYYKLPGAYLNKQLQALVHAGVLDSVSGPRGGFHLARRPEHITVLDVVLALEGPEPAFRCEGILGNVPDADQEQNYVRTCLISQTMRQAELAWRQALARQTIAGIADSMERRFPQDRVKAVSYLAAGT